MNHEEQKKIILDYLEAAYTGARMMDDLEMMCRLFRAIVAFDYDNLEEELNWDKMEDAYMLKMFGE